MTSLKDTLLTSENRPKVIADAVALVEAEVQGKSGLSGMAIKAAFAAVNKMKPALVRDAVDTLLDRFVARLEPFFAEWDSSGRSGSFGAHLNREPNRVANALLAVTDARAREIQSGPVKGAYERLRPTGEKNVEAAVPGLARALDRYVG